MNKEQIKIIEQNFKKYFSAEKLAYIIENGGYSNFQSGHKVTIDFKTNALWCIEKNEYYREKYIKYFSLPKYIEDYANSLNRAIEWEEVSKNKTLKDFIQDTFNAVGHFGMEDNTGDFYLKEKLLESQKERLHS